MYECEFCKSVFGKKSHLTQHKKCAKYCILIQNRKTYTCEFCDSVYENQFFFSNHYALCSNSGVTRKLIEYKKSLENSKHQNDLLSTQLRLREEELVQKNERIVFLEEKLLSSRQTINNTVTTNNIVNNFQPITQEYLNNCAQYLTLEHINDGDKGYASFALEHPLKDKIVCVDISRNKVKYKENNKVIADVGMKKILKKIAKSIEQKNTSLINNELNNILSIWTDLANEPAEYDEVSSEKHFNDLNQHSEKFFNILQYRDEIKKLSKNSENEIGNKIAKEICSRI